MNLEKLLGWVAIPILFHAILLFFQSFRKGPSQYDDLLDIQIDGLSNTMKLQALFDVNLSNNRFFCKDILTAALVWSNSLRRLGLIPIMLYILFFLLLLTRGAFKEQVNIQLLFDIIIGVAISLQVLHVLLKAYSNIPELLRCLHKDYKDSSFLLVLFDIVPLLRRVS